MPVADITMRIEEGSQYFVNRITFTGNTTTRDNVIRREMRLLEGNVFSTEALKFSVRRLNQLGYFKNIEGNDKDMKVDKTPGKTNTVDVTLKFEEQNRNQLTFGAGVSQYEGIFGQLAFQTSNFMGRGESLTLSMTAGDRSQNYQLGFTEPFLFDRNITGGFDIYKRSLQYIGYYTQKSTGGNMVFGFPVANFSRMFFNYSYETTSIGDLNEALIDQSCLLRPTGLLDHLVGGRSVAADADAGGHPAAQPVRLRLAAGGAGRVAHDQQGRPAVRPQHGGQPDLPVHRPPPDGLDRPGDAAGRQHQFHQAARRRHHVLQAHVARRRSGSAPRPNTSRRWATRGAS